MSQGFSVRNYQKSVVAHCKAPAPRCFLYRVFTPLSNLRVWGSKKFDKSFECTVVLRGTAAEIQEAMPAVVDIVRQTCAVCQKQQRGSR